MAYWQVALCCTAVVLYAFIVHFYVFYQHLL